ncbi:MAG: rhodanese-like domain-containing protein [Thermoanaerobaculia bacterium]
MRILQTLLIIVVAGCLLVAQPLTAADGHLVDVRWLEKHLGDPNILVLDASPAQAYANKHIPGAVNLDAMTYGVDDRPLAAMDQLFQSAGVSPDKKVVLYDQGGSMFATRLFFSLEYHGFPVKNLMLLDGGLTKWEASGLPVTKDATPPPAKGTFKAKLNEGVRVRLPEFLNASGDPEHNVLLEALTPDWHFGAVAPFDRPGHVPNAVLMPSADFFAADKTFKSPDEIARMLSHLGVRRDQKIYTHCGGGVAASVPYFALRFMLDYPEVKLYPESQLGWLSDERELPYWTYDEPFLMKEASWLRVWGGRMLRMYGISKVSVVDVRPADVFGEGHAPFSLNVPAEVFRSHLADPKKLAAVLGPAGVNPAHEAVIVSGGGLTKEAALAFVLFEALGQKRVSVLLDPMDRWAAAGLAPTKDATAVGPKNGPQDLSIPPATYPAQVRANVIITDPEGPAGLYPKIFIASGDAIPARACATHVVQHVPYKSLLNADGTPKAAKEIWSILSKAGITRYAELICFSDDPAEAAANYYLLRLMGFPDVKMLVM